MTLRFILNDDLVDTDERPGTPVLDWLRSARGLRGTKEGCREGDCGACLVLLGRRDGPRVAYRAQTSCLLPLAEVDGSHLVTVEGLGGDGLSPAQRLLVEEGAIQCGFCTPGLVVALTGFLLAAERPDLESAIAAVEGNICRCTGYASIRRAAARLVALAPGRPRGRRAGARPGRGRGSCRGGSPPFPTGSPASTRRRPRATRAARSARPRGRHRRLRPAAGRDRCGRPLPALPSRARRHLERRERTSSSAPPPPSRRSSPRRCCTDVVPGLHRAPAPGLVPAHPPPRHGRRQHRQRLAHRRPDDHPPRPRRRRRARPDGRHPRPCPSPICSGLQAARPRGRASWRWVRFPLDRRHGPLQFREGVRSAVTLDIASVNSAISLRVERGAIADAHVAAGGVAPVPLVLTADLGILAGARCRPRPPVGPPPLAAREIAPISDVRGSAAYKSGAARAPGSRPFPGPRSGSRRDLP